MTKGELFELLKDMSDEEELFVVSASYDPEDDSTWEADTQTEITKVVASPGEVLIYLEVDGFM